MELLAGIKNIYLPQLPLLAKTTMRIGMTTAIRQCCTDSPLTLWLGVCSKVSSIKLVQLTEN